MIRLALVEDDALYRSQLREYIDKYSAASGEKFTVTEFSDGDEIALGYKAVYDIILMDIEMKFMDGMMAAEEIRKKDTEVIIIFITNSPQYAIKGYAVDALDYVLKPVSYYAFSQRLSRAIERAARRARHYLQINAHGTAETETRLAQDSFFRVNKGCLVNLEHVDCMDGEDAVVHGERVPIARARRKAFLDALNDYINGAG